MKKRLLENESCGENWNDMDPTCSGRFCATCQTNLEDLTELSLGELVSNHLGSGKCVRLTETQIHFLSFYKSAQKAAVISSIVVGTSFFNSTYAQSIKNAATSKDSCLVTGKAVFDDDGSPSRNVAIYVTAGGKTYETTTDNKGHFAINLPKNAPITYSNVKKLQSKNTKNRNKMRLGKNKIHRDKRRMGWL